MSLTKSKLFVNDLSIEICVLNPERPFDEWIYCVPSSVLLIRLIPIDEVLQTLYKNDYEIIKELNSDKKIFEFWECLIAINDLTQKVWITPFSFLKIFSSDDKV